MDLARVERHPPAVASLDDEPSVSVDPPREALPGRRPVAATLGARPRNPAAVERVAGAPGLERGLGGLREPSLERAQEQLA